jgi:hypothetical protein
VGRVRQHERTNWLNPLARFQNWKCHVVFWRLSKNDKCQRHLTSMSPTGWAHGEAESSAIDHMHEMCMCRESDCVDPAATHDAPANYISELIAWRRLLSGSAEKRRRSPCGRLRCPNAAHLLVTQYWRTNDAGCLMSVCLSRRACIAVWRVCQRTALSYDDC